jgi:hypothetical protein
MPRGSLRQKLGSGILKLSCNDLSFRSVLENLIRTLAVRSIGLMNECAESLESAYRRRIWLTFAHIDHATCKTFGKRRRILKSDPLLGLEH